MESFAQLRISCELLENSLNEAIVGAVSFSDIDNKNHAVDGWEKIINNKLNDLKLLNSKEILLNSTVHQDQYLSIQNLTNDVAITRLNNATECHGRWNNALKTKVISKAVHHYFNSDSNENKLQFQELLLKLSMLDKILDRLSLSEEEKMEKLFEASLKWKNVATKWSEKKRIYEEYMIANTQEINNDSLDNHMSKLITKMETMRNIQGRLLGSCMSYDWLRDPAKLEPYLTVTRKPSFKPEDFL